MSKRHREVVCKAPINDSDYFKICKTVTKLSNQSKSFEEEASKLRRENEELKESKKVLEEMLEEVKRQFELKLQKKEQHIAHLTRRNAKLQSAHDTLKEELDKRKYKHEEQKKKIDDLERLNEEQDKILTDCTSELEATEKQLLVAEEVNSELQTKLEEAEAEIKKLNEVHELEKASMFLAACARKNALIIYDDGMDDSLNERICDLSDGDDNPPSDHLIPSDMNYNNIVVAETDQSDMNYNSIVVARTDNNVEQNPGVSVAGGKGSPNGDLPICIRSVIPECTAARDGWIRQGDVILSVNGISFENISHKVAVEILTRFCGDITLKLCSP